jgi:hypothetical protein
LLTSLALWKVAHPERVRQVVSSGRLILARRLASSLRLFGVNGICSKSHSEDLPHPKNRMILNGDKICLSMSTNNRRDACNW